MASLIQLLSTYLSFICLLSSFLKNANALDRRSLLAKEELHYHTTQVSFLLPESTTACKPSSQGSKDKTSSLEIVHRHGPCSKISQDKPNKRPTWAEILSKDEARVKSIQARLAYTTDSLKERRFRGKDKKTVLPAQPGASYGSGNYLVTVGIGTPEKSLTLIFDTGSDLTWTQCQPCKVSCYNQTDQIFDPAQSTTYKNISCNSPTCIALKSATGMTPRCSNSSNACIYGIQYGDQSFSVGYFGQERFTLTPQAVFDNISFGCGQDNDGLFGETAGLVGLGRNTLSIVSQTAAKYGKYFSYCLPSFSGSGGHLTFGKTGTVSENVKFTPLDTSRGDSFYEAIICGISVGGRPLNISSSVLTSSPTIIDSGTVVTRLPASIYRPLRDAFRQGMSNFKMAQPISILDTCYDLSGTGDIQIPTIVFYFCGNVTVNVVPDGILLVATGPSQVCLAFAEDSTSIFGNLQQQTFEVVYDVAGGMLGFAPNGCT